MFDCVFNPYLEYTKLDNIIKIASENGVKANFKAEEILLYPYEYPDYCYFINSGLVKIIASDFNGKEHIRSIAGKGVTIGAISLLSGSKNKESFVKIIEPTIVYKISRNSFFSLMDSSKVFHDYILQGLVDSVRIETKIISNFTLFSCKKMLTDLLFYSIDNISGNSDQWYKLKYRYSNQQLMDILGVSRSTLHRTISTLRNDGIIRIINNELEVKIPKTPITR